jgi:hypothetical protein
MLGAKKNLMWRVDCIEVFCPSELKKLISCQTHATNTKVTSLSLGWIRYVCLFSSGHTKVGRNGTVRIHFVGGLYTAVTFFFIYLTTLSVAQKKKRRMTVRLLNWKRYGRKRSWPNLRYNSGICLEGQSHKQPQSR